MLINEVTFNSVENSDEIQSVVNLAYQLFPIYYKDYVRQEHYEFYLKIYQSNNAIKTQIQSGEEYFLVYIKDDLVGYLGFSVVDNDCFLSKIYLKEEFLGFGIGA